jgi:hypothetical protein
MNKQFFIFFCMFLLLGCDLRTSFYKSYEVEDMWRLPLIKPYELLTLRRADAEINPYWDMDLISTPKIQTYPSRLLVTKVNVLDSFIYGYGPFSSEDELSYFLINVKDQKEYIFKDSEQWVLYLKGKKIDSNSLKTVWDVFYSFKETGNLPWRLKN